MAESIHGHEVMRMMIENEQNFTRETLLSAITDRFGDDARFHTCSAEDMTPDELIDFLGQKGKFIESPAGFNTSADQICDH